MYKPDVLLRKDLDLIIGNILVHERLTDRIGCSEEFRMTHQHMHGHISSIRTSAEIYAVQVYIRVLIKIFVDA